MKLWKYLNHLPLCLLVACSTSAPKVGLENHNFKPGLRAVASIDDVKDELSSERVNNTIKGIFHSYLLGQVLLQDFDKLLDENPSVALDSDNYHELQAIRIMVDEFEEHINDLYIKLVLVSALPKFNSEQKLKAELSLKKIGDFLNGVTTNKKLLPENLRPLILSNLREKQTILYDELKALRDDSLITNNDPEVISIINANMILLRATRMNYFKNLMDYHIDGQTLKMTLAEQENDSDFKHLKSNIKRMSKEIKKFMKEVNRGRNTSSDTIFPNTGAAGNISGNGFPANTWSLTYDDGPGSKTSPLVLQNLKERNMKATFFMLAKQVEALPSTAKTIADAGMDIASHSYDHAQLTKVGPIALEKQIGDAKKIIEDKLGKPVKLFRLPYGAGVSVANIRAKIAEHNLIHVFWNVDTLDWQDKNPTSIYERSIKQMNASPKNNGIVLFHDIHQQSVIASTMLMDYFKKKNITVCTVQAVVDQLNQGLDTCRP